MIACRRLGRDDAAQFAALRLRGLREQPADFGEDSAEFEATPFDVHERRLEPRPDNAAVLGAFRDRELVGIVGLYRRPDRRKHWHRANVFGTYVIPEQRRRGVAVALMRQLFDYARGQPGLDLLTLEVGRDNVAARSLYESVGFVAWGVEPRALRVDGIDRDLVHMTRDVATP